MLSNRIVMLIVIIAGCFGSPLAAQEKPFLHTQDIFPLVKEHVHGSTIVEIPSGDLLAAWFQGSGERQADDVRIMGAKLQNKPISWSKPFLMADVPGFPDINPILFLDGKKRLWLVWYTVIANQWETSLPKYRISTDYDGEGPPRWDWQEVLHVKPGGSTKRGIQPNDRFVKSIERQIDQYADYFRQTSGLDPSLIQPLVDRWRKEILPKARGEDMMAKGYLYKPDGTHATKLMGYPYFRRMGWQTKNKAVVLDGGRIIVPLYSDGFSFSLMAITDDDGRTWQFSEPLVAPGNIQPSIALKKDGTLVAYMRDNGPPPQRLHVSSSTDRGLTWSTVKDSQLPNPGSGADLVTLKNGHWVLAYNDTEDGRHSLAISISTDEGKTWPYKRHLELDKRPRNKATRSHYPSIIQGRDGTLHVTYSYHHNDRGDKENKTIKYAHFNEAWAMGK